MKSRLLPTVLLSLAALTSTDFARAAEPGPIRVDRPIPVPTAGPRLVESAALVRAAEAREQFKVNGKGLGVAIIDTGIRPSHADFTGRIVAQREFLSKEILQTAIDENGHGTHITAIIAGNGPHVGIAPGASIISLRVLGADGTGSFVNVERALKWVIDNHTQFNITVVNLSISDGQSFQDYPKFGLMYAHIQTLRSMNIAVVASAGNEFYTHQSEQGMGFPSIFPETVSVGAVFDADVGRVEYASDAIAFTTGADRICPFSQRLHPSVSATYRTNIFAPGGPIISAGIADDNASATITGTSQAAPVVAGAILLLQELFQRETGKLPPVEMIERVLDATGVTIKDGDDEDDNVENTQLDFKRLDIVALLQGLPLREDLDGDGTPDVIDPDIDGDGFSNQTERAMSSDPRDPLSIPVSSNASSTPVPLTLSAFGVKLNFSKGTDDITLAGIVPVGADYVATGQVATLVVGGVKQEFTIDAKGKGTGGLNTLKLALKFKSGALVANPAAKFSAKLKGPFAEQLVDEGLVNSDVAGALATVRVEFFFDGDYYLADVPVSYSAKAGKSGKAAKPK